MLSLLLAITLSIDLTSSSSLTPQSWSMDIKSNSNLAFCDGPFYVPKSRKSCPQGLTFGPRPPKCVCIKGIYRMYLSNCEVADGFANEVCTLLKDNEQNMTVKGVKLTREVKWDRTALVSEKGTGFNKDWDITAEGGTAHVSAKYFYTINGDAFSSKAESLADGGKAKLQICVERNPKSKNKICLYKHADNLEHWHIEKSTIVHVPSKSKCPEKKGPWTPMRARQCFDPLDILDSECQPTCSKRNLIDDDERHEEPIDILEDADLDTNITDPRPYNKHEHDYLDRKLNTYWMLQELDMVHLTPVNLTHSQHGPNKTFALLKIMKDITKNYCPHKFVPRFWIDQVIELFQLLHRGDILKYENELTDHEFRWIRDILSKCQDHHQNSIPLAASHEDSRCDFGVKKAMGYCPSGQVETCTADKAIPSPPSEAYADFDHKHFVPEVTWLVLDIVHVVCFPQFNESYRMFHLLEQTVEKLFTNQIKNYWFNPSWSQRVKRMMLGQAADDFMWNMEVCAQAAYSSKNYTVHRLIRPDPLKYLSFTDIERRKKRAVGSFQKSIGKNVDVYCPKSKSQFQYPGHCENMKLKTNIHKPQVIFSQS